MTIDEAIKHCNEVVSEESCKDTASNKACGSEHKQLAEWLVELKRTREQLKEKQRELRKDIDRPNSL